MYCVQHNMPFVIKDPLEPIGHVPFQKLSFENSRDYSLYIQAQRTTTIMGVI